MSQINIDEQALKKKIKKDKLNFIDVIEYDLSEIVFQAKNQNELNSKINEIKSWNLIFLRDLFLIEF